jgi:peptidase E
MNLLIVSTSTVYGKPYLSYLEMECKDFFSSAKKILFIPFARPGGISHDAYTARAKEVFEAWGFEMRGAHEFDTAEEGTIPFAPPAISMPLMPPYAPANLIWVPQPAAT